MPRRFAQVRQQLQLDQFALGHLRPAFHLAAMIAQHRQLRHIAARPASLDRHAEQAMYGQIRIAANRRGEMAVILAGQGVVIVLDRAVHGLLEAAQQSVMDRVRFRLVRGQLQDVLQGEAIRFLLHLVAENAGELGEGLELGRLRGGMDAAQKGDAGPVEMSATASLARSMNSSII